MDVNEVMKEKGIVLPVPPQKGGLYNPCKIVGNMAYISGCGCLTPEMPSAAGKLGRRGPGSGAQLHAEYSGGSPA